MKQKLPIGIDNFEKLRKDNFYYVDKTGLIRELLENWGEVNLFTRPRRFGKSLNMSMLQSFFSTEGDPAVFQGLEIMRETKLCEEYMGKYPVISVTLKGINGQTYETAFKMAVRVINEAAAKLEYLLDSPRLSGNDRQNLQELLDREMDEAALFGSIREMSRLLKKHFGREVIILIDEYDVPLAKAFENGYYDQMIFLIRGMFEQALKTNENLKFAVLTGCMVDVYCPWDVLNYCDVLRTDPEAQPQNFWMNTSGNDAVRVFIEKAENGTTKREIESLIAGEEITKEIRQELTYKDMYESIDNIWSVLFTTGYLTQRGNPDGRRFRLAIPNVEIRNIFTSQIMELFKIRVREDGHMLSQFCDALEKGDAPAVEQYFRENQICPRR